MGTFVLLFKDFLFGLATNQIIKSLYGVVPYKSLTTMKKTLLAIFITLVANMILAQEEQPFKIDYTIQSKAFGDERKISVYLPPSYYEDEHIDYTVTYILDGQHDPFIDMGAKIIEYGTYNYKYTPTIVVGIHAKQRGWEFSLAQPGDEEFDYEGGRAPELQEHFRNEVFPLIDSIYTRTQPYRNIIGHSSGGLFVLYTLFSEANDLFDGYMAISPSIREDSEYIYDHMVKRLKSGQSINKFLYCSAGSVGDRERLFGAAVDQIDSLLMAYPNHGIIWHKSKLQGTGHWSVVAPSFNDGMLALTRAFRVDEKLLHEFALNEKKTMGEQIDAFYAGLEEQYGFKELPLSGYLGSVAWDIWEVSDKKNFKAAIELYDWALEQYPNDYRITKSKAKLQLRSGDKASAHASFKSCLEMLEEDKKTISEERYDNQLKFLSEKIVETAKE